MTRLADGAGLLGLVVLAPARPGRRPRWRCSRAARSRPGGRRSTRCGGRRRAHVHRVRLPRRPRGGGAASWPASRARGVILVAMGPLAAQIGARDAARGAARLLHGAGPRQARADSRRPASPGVAFPIPVKNQLAAFRHGEPPRRRASASCYNPDAAEIVEEAQKAARARAPGPGTPGPVTSDQRAARRPARAVQRRRRRWTPSGCPPDPMLLGDETRRFLLSESTQGRQADLRVLGRLVAEGALVSNGPDYVASASRRGSWSTDWPRASGSASRCWCRGRSW